MRETFISTSFRKTWICCFISRRLPPLFRFGLSGKQVFNKSAKKCCKTRCKKWRSKLNFLFHLFSTLKSYMSSWYLSPHHCNTVTSVALSQQWWAVHNIASNLAGTGTEPKPPAPKGEINMLITRPNGR